MVADLLNYARGNPVVLDKLHRLYALLAVSPSEKPGSEERRGSALLESAQGLSDPGMADVPSEKPGSEEYDEGKYGDWRDNPGNYGE